MAKDFTATDGLKLSISPISLRPQPRTCRFRFRRSNPYYPIGAPANLVVNYNIGLETPPYTDGNEIADRYLVGLNFDLPARWEGRIYYSESFDGTHTNANSVNQSAVSAALGWTIPAGFAIGTSPAVSTWTRPATIPYLNLFCDPRAFTCNSPSTLQYITGHRVADHGFLGQ